MPVSQVTRRPLYVASDARLDESAPPSLAVLIYDPEDRSRTGFCSVLPVALRQRWSVQQQYIALVELAAPVTAVFWCKKQFKNRDIVWFIDNSAALSCLVKGGSSSEDMDRGTSAVHLALAEMRARVWWEYVESKANWSDTASRLLFLDPWCLANSFSLDPFKVPEWVWFVEPHQLLGAVKQTFDP